MCGAGLEEPVPPLIVEGSGLMMATLTLSFEELLTRPLKQAQAHAEALRKEIKHRQSLLLDYDHHKVRPGTVEEDVEQLHNPAQIDRILECKANGHIP